MNRLNTFDSIARYYDRLARLVFGKAMVSSQTEFLGDIPSSSKVLVLGGGSGWWMNELLRTRPDCKVLFVEPSKKMLALASNKVGNDKRVCFLHGTAESVIEETDFDFVLIFFVFDMFPDNELARQIETIKPLLSEDGFWVISDFVENKWWHSCLLFVMYTFFGAVTKLRNRKLPMWENRMEQEGFVAWKQNLHYGGFIKSAMYRRGPIKKYL